MKKENQENSKKKSDKGKISIPDFKVNPVIQFPDLSKNIIQIQDYTRPLIIPSDLSESFGRLSAVTDDFTELFSNFTGASSFNKQLKLESEITELRGKLKESIDNLKAVKEDDEKKAKTIDELKKIQQELSKKERLNHILPRICEKARSIILDSEKFRNEFKNLRTCEAVVVSIDIRRSTELMLKARSPQLYSQFITTLANKLSNVILANFGVFDKFTGDGILAFFPTFYSGEQAILRALIAAEHCHQIFNEHYLASKDSFNIFIKDIGLGIGIDFGEVSLVNEHNEFTVVGVPVVYACRLSGTQAGTTILNLAAKKSLEDHLPGQAIFASVDIPIKNEGVALAYTASLNLKSIKVNDPIWETD
ncbi:MAG: hypothetical protein H6606_05290 [Flavobacteriales bacterium]|nr:hypothetical protein [Flavobacteriales bacterium]